MNNVYEGQVIWSQIDANMHLRHSAYADFAAQARLALMDEMGLNFSVFQKLMIGPILFREELTYLREVGINDTVKVTTVLTKARGNGARWSIRHEIFRGDGVKVAIVNVDGAWLDLRTRKLAELPQDLGEHFMTVPKSQDYYQEEE